MENISDLHVKPYAFSIHFFTTVIELLLTGMVSIININVPAGQQAMLLHRPPPMPPPKPATQSALPAPVHAEQDRRQRYDQTSHGKSPRRYRQDSGDQTGGLHLPLHRVSTLTVLPPQGSRRQSLPARECR